jgi:Sulfotransferase family
MPGFVMTHRDVGTVLVSVCALMHALSSPLADQTDPMALGRFNTQLWSASLRRLIDFRDSGHGERFHDVSFAEMQADPIGTVSRLYTELGDELTADTHDRMIEWWKSSAERRRPASYRAETFGLDAAELRKQFGFYHDRYGVLGETP